jgi:hypothetical protein
MRDFDGFPLQEASSARSSDRPTAILSASEQRRLVADTRTHVVKSAPPAEPRESDFWNSGPRYSTTSAYPELALSVPPRPRPSLRRRVLTKLLFTVLFSAVLLLLAYEASIVFRFSWVELYRGVF